MTPTGWPSPLIARPPVRSGQLHHGRQHRKLQMRQCIAARVHCSLCKAEVNRHPQVKCRRRPTAASRQADPSFPFRHLLHQEPLPRAHKIRSEYHHLHQLDRGGRHLQVAATVPTPFKYLRRHLPGVVQAVLRLLFLAVAAAPEPFTYRHPRHSPSEAWCPHRRAPPGATKISRTRILRLLRPSDRKSVV